MTTSIIPATETNKALLSSVLETKLTRTELIDLIVNRIHTDYAEEHERLKVERDALDTDLPLADAARLVKQFGKPGDAKLHLKSYWDAEKKFKLCITVAIDQKEELNLSKSYTKAVEKKKSIDDRMNKLRKQMEQLKGARRAGRAELVRIALESSPEGAKILLAITELQNSVKQKLLEAA